MSIEYLGSPAPGDYTIRVSCSKGTYIRVLAEDIGTALGVPATLAALRRTQAGAFSIEQCHTLPEILAAAESGALKQSGWLLPIETVFAPLPAPARGQCGVKAHLLNGCPMSHYPADDGRYRVYDPAGAFLGLAASRAACSMSKNYFAKGTDAHANLSHLDARSTPRRTVLWRWAILTAYTAATALCWALPLRMRPRNDGLTAAAFTFELPANNTLKGGRILCWRRSTPALQA